MIGIDIVDIKSFDEKINKAYFLEKIFTQNEKIYAASKKNSLQTFAGIFAAKEAIIKSLDLNISYLIRRKIEILHNKNNKPYFLIDGRIYRKGLSISHDGNYAVAVCSIDKIIEIDKSFIDYLPTRKKDSHKGDYGRIGFWGGSKGMAGSIYMSSLSSIKSGAGLSYIICPKSISTILQIKSTESIIREVSCDNFHYDKNLLEEITNNLEKLDVLCIGPGMGKADNLNILLGEVIKKFEGKILIDADGLNAISKDVDILSSKENMVLTPHMKEFQRLTNLSLQKIKDNKEEIAMNFAKTHSQILVLKDYQTIVTDGYKIYKNKSGNPGMATAGSGDVLSGIISTLLYRINNPYDASKLGVYIHGLAGDFAKKKLGEESMLATDIINNIYEVFELFRSYNV